MWSPMPDALTLRHLLCHIDRSEHNRMRVFNSLIERAMYYDLRHGEGEAKDLKAPLGDVRDLDAERKALREALRYTPQTFGGLSDEDLSRITDGAG